MASQAEDVSRAAVSGIEGLDTVLKGGFPRDEVHEVSGGPGTGKTTLGLQYLVHGRQMHERGLYVTLSQTERGLERIAASHGLPLEGIAVHELSPGGMQERIAARQNAKGIVAVAQSSEEAALVQHVVFTKQVRLPPSGRQ
jgi:KaiC/GvpD/RAD55 family RecA-like ATPase